MKQVFISKFMSRKLLGFILATVLCFFEKINGWMWVICLAIYVGGNVLDKLTGSGKPVVAKPDGDF